MQKQVFNIRMMKAYLFRLWYYLRGGFIGEVFGYDQRWVALRVTR